MFCRTQLSMASLATSFSNRHLWQHNPASARSGLPLPLPSLAHRCPERFRIAQHQLQAIDAQSHMALLLARDVAFADYRLLCGLTTAETGLDRLGGCEGHRDHCAAPGSGQQG
jgi:hypothetical protein